MSRVMWDYARQHRMNRNVCKWWFFGEQYVGDTRADALMKKQMQVQCAKCGRVFHSSTRALCSSCRPPIRY